jgi:pyruvate/2-oxoglutarate dehydrogenase complex dihydrolipoamide dehydrogenase (E3) component
MENEYDFTVIGGGSAGYAAASLAAGAGLRVAVVEGGREVGGLCILRGCMPSKTLLATANRAAAVRGAAEFGVKARLDGVDGTAMQARKRMLIADFAGYRKGQLESGRFTFIRGLARFTGTHTVDIALEIDARRRIIEAAGQAFRERGVAETGVDEVMRRAGLRSPSARPVGTAAG